jgi:PHD/YefM family antitoxin component YafN of YafNO toxin-antitoxin module
MLNLKELNVQYITNEAGERSGIIMSMEDFEALLETLEDLAVVAKRRDEPTVSYEDLKAQLIKDGLLPN